MAPPDFSSTALFPSFQDLPSVLSPPSSRPFAGWTLVAQVHEDMTITKPTLVLKDRGGSPFALIFDEHARGDLDFKRLGLRKGATVVLPSALRTPPREEGKRGFVAVGMEQSAEVRAVPGPLERVLALAERLRAKEEGVDGEVCERCGERKAEGALLRCTGCGDVRYCSKECQTKDWNEGGHKADCKIYRGIGAIWG